MNETKQEKSPAAKEPPPAPLATVQHESLAHTPPQPGMLEGADVMSRVRLEPKNFQEAMFCAELAYKMRLGKCDSVADAMIRVMRGSTIGLDTITSVEQIYVVGERTGLYAKLMHALVLRSPLCAEFKIVEEQCTDTMAVVRARRRGAAEATIYKFTAEEAKRLVGDKFDTKDSNYQKDRKGMLISKALSRAAQREWPDVLMGFVTIEDLRDDANSVETNGESAPASLPVQVRDYEREIVDLIDKVDAAASDDDFKAARAAIAAWDAPETFRSRAVGAYNAAKKAHAERAKTEPTK